MRRWLHPLGGALGALVLLAGMALHLTVRDEVAAIGPVFYALSLPVILVGWMGLAVWFVRQTRVMAACLFLAVVTAAWWQSVSEGDSSPRPSSTSSPTLKVMYWNMAHQPLPSAELESALVQHQPDIIGLGETGLRHGDPNALVRHLPAGYTVLRPDHGMALVVRGQGRSLGVTKVSRRSKFVELEATVDSQVWHVVLVDGDATPTLPRRPLLDRVLKAAQPKGKRTLILGDFNTPVESTWFTPWRTAGWGHSADASRTGFRETWPWPWPVLTIDHIWTSPDLAPLTLQRLRQTSSDHLALLLQVGVR